jgi:hypothetical protein
MNNDQYLLAAMGRDSKGRMTVDMNEFRKVQGMSFDEVQNRAADALRQMDSKGIFEWNTRRQEFKDQVAQKLRPGEMQMMVLQQARAFQGQFRPGEMSLGSALQATTGMGADQARSLELQFSSRKYWDAQVQQLQVQRGELAERERSAREEFRTPGLMTRARRGFGNFMGDVSDTLSSPFRSVAHHFERVAEDKAAQARGERINRYGESDIAHDEGERSMLRESLRRGGIRQRSSGANFVDQVGTGGLGGALGRSAGRQLNRMGSFLGLSSDSDANKLAAIADYSKGRYTSLGETFGDPEEALRRVQDVASVGAAYGAAPLTGAQTGTLYQRIADAGGGKKISASAVLGATTQAVVSDLKNMKAGYIKSARAYSESDFKKAYIEKAKSVGNMTDAQAEASWKANKRQIMSNVVEEVRASGDKSLIEPLAKAAEVAHRAGAVDLSGSEDEAKKAISDKLKMSGMGDISDKGMQAVKAVLANNDDETVMMAAAIRARTSGNAEEKKVAERTMKDLEEKMGSAAFGEKKAQATKLATSMSEDVSDAFQRTFRGTQDTKGVEASLKLVRQAAGDKMKLAAQKEFKQKLDRVHKGAGGAKSVEEAVGMISDDEIDQLDKQTADAIRAFRKGGEGSEEALLKAIERAGPKSTKTRHGGGSSEALDALDQQIADLESARDQYATQEGGDADTGLQAQSTTLFATAVKDFAGAVKDMRGGTDTNALAWANPWVQARLGGG